VVLEGETKITKTVGEEEINDRPQAWWDLLVSLTAHWWTSPSQCLRRGCESRTKV